MKGQWRYTFSVDKMRKLMRGRRGVPGEKENNGSMKAEGRAWKEVRGYLWVLVVGVAGQFGVARTNG